MLPSLTRRQFLAGSSAVLSTSLFTNGITNAAGQHKFPTRVITHGPRHHWFGYYDKWQFDPANRFVLSNEVSFEHRSPNADDQVGIGMVDLDNQDEWIPLGTSTAWGWQQGCMLQWIPESSSKILWNDREHDQYVCRIMDVSNREVSTIDSPIYSLSPDGKTAVTLDFRRVQELRPGYGYSGLDDPHREEMTPESSGIWKVNLKTGHRELIFSIAQIARYQPNHPNMEGAKHYFNHLLVSPDGQRLIFLHRWRPNGGRDRFYTRMFTANLDGTDLYLLDRSGRTSHFIWRDPQHICAWSEQLGYRGFFLFKDQTDEVIPVGAETMKKDGHNTYLPQHDNNWILCDTYPTGPQRIQSPYLYHIPTKRQTVIGQFPSPDAYRGEWRCDTHPRYSRDGQFICVDSPHQNQGRQLHLIDISAAL